MLDSFCLVLPAALFDVGLPLRLGQFLDAVSRIPQNAVKDAAPHVFPGGIAFVSQLQHEIGQLQGLLNALISWRHGQILSQVSDLDWFNGNMPGELGCFPETFL